MVWEEAGLDDSASDRSATLFIHLKIHFFTFLCKRHKVSKNGVSCCMDLRPSWRGMAILTFSHLMLYSVAVTFFHTSCHQSLLLEFHDQLDHL